MQERFVLRDEPFGATVFDRQTLGYKYVEAANLGSDIYINGVKVDRYEHWKTDLSAAPRDLLYAPIRVYIETTRVCNLRCRTCFNASGTADPDEMSTDQLFKALEGMRQDNIFDVRFTGGEFTKRPDWQELLQKAINLGFGVSMNTNGAYDDPSIVDKIAAIEGLAQVTVSIDGTRDDHDYIRGRGNFDRTLQNLKALNERGVTLRTNTVVTKRTVSKMEDIIQAVGPYLDEMNFFHMRFTGRAQNIVREALSFEDLYEFNQRAKEIVKRYPQLNILFGSQATRANSIRMNQLGLRMGGPDGFTRFNLLANGSIWAGGYVPYIDRRLEMGNINEEDGNTTLRIWRGSKKLNGFRKFSRDLLLRCLNCAELDRRCPGINVEMELARLKQPDLGNPYCISDQPLPLMDSEVYEGNLR